MSHSMAALAQDLSSAAVSARVAWRRSTASDVEIVIGDFAKFKNIVSSNRLIPPTLRSNQFYFQKIQLSRIKFEHGSGAVKNHGDQLGSSKELNLKH